MGMHQWGTTNIGPAFAESLTVNSYVAIGASPATAGELRLPGTFQIKCLQGGQNLRVVLSDGAGNLWLGDSAIAAERFNSVILDANGAVWLRNAGNNKGIFNATGVGFNGASPAAVPDYTVTNHTNDRALDETADTLVQGHNVQGTSINDLIVLGLFQ